MEIFGFMHRRPEANAFPEAPANPLNETDAERRTSFPLIDVLRGFAALSVVVFHVIAHYKWETFPITSPLVWFRIGGMGVDLFFVISGFVIALSAFSRLQKTGYTGFVSSFARARLARIVPLHYLTCIVFLVFIQPEILFVPDIWKQVLSHAAFVHSWILEHQGGINGVNWSVAVEMQFYVLMIFIAPWLMKAPILHIALIGTAIAWFWRLATFMFVSSTGEWGTVPVFVFSSELPGMLDEFAIGVILARLVTGPRHEAIFAWTRSYPFALPAVTAVALTAILHVYWQNSTYWNSGWMVGLFKTPLAVGWGLVLLSACTLQHPSLVRLTAPLRYLGTISYGIYLWHLPVLLAFKRVSWMDGPKVLPWVIGTTLVLAAISWHFFEKPLLDRYGRSKERANTSARKKEQLKIASAPCSEPLGAVSATT